MTEGLAYFLADEEIEALKKGTPVRRPSLLLLELPESGLVPVIARSKLWSKLYEKRRPHGQWLPDLVIFGVDSPFEADLVVRVKRVPKAERDLPEEFWPPDGGGGVWLRRAEREPGATEWTEYRTLQVAGELSRATSSMSLSRFEATGFRPFWVDSPSGALSPWDWYKLGLLRETHFGHRERLLELGERRFRSDAPIVDLGRPSRPVT